MPILRAPSNCWPIRCRRRKRDAAPERDLDLLRRGEATSRPTPPRARWNRQAAATAALGHDCRSGRRQRLLVGARRVGLAADQLRRTEVCVLAGDFAVGVAVGGTNLTLTPANAIESSGVWNDTEYPAHTSRPRRAGAAQAPWKCARVAAGNPVASAYRMVPDVAAFADPSPGYAIICSHEVQGCGPSPGHRSRSSGARPRRRSSRE